MAYYESFDEAFAAWQHGDKVASHKSYDGDRYLVTQSERGFNVYRAFMVGPRIALSVDLEDGDLEAAFGIAFEA